jgi:hypothetical protein
MEIRERRRVSRRGSSQATSYKTSTFAWAGGIERGQPHYYRLQGPRRLAEYDNTQRHVNRIRTVWRDPRGDFGDVLAPAPCRVPRRPIAMG